MDHRPRRLRDQVSYAIRLKHQSIRTEESPITRIKPYPLFHTTRPTYEMASTTITAFLTHLAVPQTIAASTQHHTLSAFLFPPPPPPPPPPPR